jgi:hypothetical protein
MAAVDVRFLPAAAPFRNPTSTWGRAFLEKALQCEAIGAGLGIVFVFNDEGFGQHFLAKRYTETCGPTLLPKFERCLPLPFSLSGRRLCLSTLRDHCEILRRSGDW